MSEPPAVRLRGLVKRFGRRRALDGVDLSIEGRAIVGVLGPDGAGKTTLLRALAGLMEVEADEALVLGHDLRKDVTALKADVGYVPQVFSLHRDLTVCENLRFTARVARMDAADFEARSAELLARTRLAPFADRAAGKLSGGMKQKLAIANALLPRPRLVLLDEATAGVDVIARDEIWALLGHAREGALVVASTSYLDEAERCDRVVYMDAGRVVATGSAEELRGRVPHDLFRAWGADPRAIARAAGRLAYVEAARATRSFARIEVARDRAPGAARMLADLRAADAGSVRFLEPAALDVESALLYLAGRAAS